MSSKFKNHIDGDVYFTSDLHLGHANIASENTSQWDKGYRHYEGIEEHDALIIDNINKTVPTDGILVFHGDFSFGGHTKIPDYRRRIACENIIFIRGNHDSHIDKYSDFFTSVQDYWEGTINSEPWVCMHYAMRIWLGSHKGFYHTYGHSHSSLEHIQWGRSMDVGIDNAYKILGEHRPFSHKEVLNMLKARPIKIIDNHGSGTNVR